MTPKDLFEFNEKKLKLVNTLDVRPNDWNPKKKDDPEYKKVLKSVEINGLTQPIFVRHNPDGNSTYEILDGEHRHRAAMDLGIEKIYIYDEGEVPDDLAKSLTIWHEVGVKMDDVQLAPLVVELNAVNIELPLTETEIENYKAMADFDFESAYADTEPVQDEDDGFKTLAIKMTAEQYEVVRDAIDLVMNNENVSEGRSLELLVADGLNGYKQITLAD